MVIGVTTMVVSLATAILGLYYVNCETVNILIQVKLSEVSVVQVYKYAGYKIFIKKLKAVH